MNTIAIIISTIIFVIFILWCNCFYYIWRNLVFYYNNRLSYSDNNLYSLYDILKKYNISYDDVLSVHSFVNYWKTKELGLCKDNYASKEDKNSIESLTRVIITVSNDGVNTAYVFFGNYFAYKVKANDVFMLDLKQESLKSVDDAINEYSYCN